MGKRDDSLPVYPVKVVNTSGADHKSPFRDMMLPPKSTEYCFGMTRLQHYAGLAMQAGIGKDGFHFLAPKAIASISFDMAEAMIAEYERRYGGESESSTGNTEDDPLEVAFWEFDARRKGYGPWKGSPQSERDAFKNAAARLNTGKVSE